MGTSYLVLFDHPVRKTILPIHNGVPLIKLLDSTDKLKHYIYYIHIINGIHNDSYSHSSAFQYYTTNYICTVCTVYPFVGHMVSCHYIYQAVLTGFTGTII